MKINIHADGVLLTAKQKSMIDKKIMKMKRYVPEETVQVDVVLKDITGSEKGGVDQVVHISTVIGKEKFFIEEIDDRLMRAFTYASDRFERQLSRYHQKNIEKTHKSGRIEKLFGAIKRSKKRK